ncbi:MAG: hypothetical protein HYV97_01135 [Bdellovibrio sp.]|nr:hypothetical protein [Bdellovibrio sp.]
MAINLSILRCKKCNELVIAPGRFFSGINILWRLNPSCQNCKQDKKINYYIIIEFCVLAPILLLLSERFLGYPKAGLMEFQGFSAYLMDRAIVVLCIITAYLPNIIFNRRLFTEK